MSALVFVPAHNTAGINPKTGEPWADADEFKREARLFCAFLRAEKKWPTPVHRFDNTAGLDERRAHVLRHLRGLAPGIVKVVALFCHGWPSGLQSGFRVEQAKLLARELESVSAQELTVVLWCCSTGADQDPTTDELRDPGPGGDGGFADRLRDELGELGVKATVYAHSNAGHTTRNPRVRIFLPHERAGGHWVVSPDNPLWGTWVRYLRTDGRFRFPFLSAAELEVELRR
jgi:hypothetical protein